MSDIPAVIVTAIQFGEDVINIQYLETRKQSEHGGVVESATYEVAYVEEQVNELQQNAVDLVDDILRLVANPPKVRKGDGLRMMREVDDLLPRSIPDDED